MQGYRTLEISAPSELHIRFGQLEITQEETQVSIPLEDITTIVCIGPNIRISTMGLTQITANGISLMTLDNSYKPAFVVTPVETNARQGKVVHRQASMDEGILGELWIDIVRRKIDNQARALSIIGLPGVDKVEAYLEGLNVETVDYCEAIVAKEYFNCYHRGLNRRTDDPVNSRLNYGYAVVRNAIIRELYIAGLQPAFGIHHNNQLNAFNLADDLMEPYRPMVDLVTYEMRGANLILSKPERYAVSSVLHNACLMEKIKMSALAAIHNTVVSYKRSVMGMKKAELLLPTILPIEPVEGIKE